MQKVVSINSELTRICYIEYLNRMSMNELAYWLVHSFTPTRYRDSNDVVEYACYRLTEINSADYVYEFINRLWGMFGELPGNFSKTDCSRIKKFRKLVYEKA